MKTKGAISANERILWLYAGIGATMLVMQLLKLTADIQQLKGELATVKFNAYWKDKRDTRAPSTSTETASAGA